MNVEIVATLLEENILTDIFSNLKVLQECEKLTFLISNRNFFWGGAYTMVNGRSNPNNSIAYSSCVVKFQVMNK